MKTLITTLILLTTGIVFGAEACDERIIAKGKESIADRRVLLHISNEEYGGEHYDGYFVQYFAGDSTVIGLRRDKPFLELLDEIVADIKDRDAKTP